MWQTGNMVEPRIEVVEVNDIHPSDSSSSDSGDCEGSGLRILLPLYWSDCELPSCLNFPKSVKLPTTLDAEAGSYVLLPVHLQSITDVNSEHNQLVYRA